MKNRGLTKGSAFGWHPNRLAKDKICLAGKNITLVHHNKIRASPVTTTGNRARVTYGNNHEPFQYSQYVYENDVSKNTADLNHLTRIAPESIAISSFLLIGTANATTLVGLHNKKQLITL